jgi:hypothetical protein
MLSSIEKKFEDLSISVDKKVLSIDIGVNNLGISYTYINEDFTIDRIVFIKLIDMTVFNHNKVPVEECKLHHGKNFNDWVDHVIQEYSEVFKESDYILIERQPPLSPFTAIEQLIFSHYRDKAVLISPCSVHKFLSINHLDYNDRKKQTVKIARLKLSDELKTQFDSYERQHDIADSIVQMLYWCGKNNCNHRINEQKKLAMLKHKNIFEYMDTFRYVPKK